MKFLLDKLSKTAVYLIPLLIFTTISLKGDVGLTKTIDNSVIITQEMVTDIDVKPMVAYTEPMEMQVPKKKQQVVLSRGGSGLTELSERDKIKKYVREISAKYNMDPALIMGMIEVESGYNPKAKNGNCLGLMQISKRWHADRAARLGVTDFYDSYSNVLLGIDYMSEMLVKYKDPRLVLMLYNMEHNTALKMYKSGQISGYAKTVLAKAEQYRKGE